MTDSKTISTNFRYSTGLYQQSMPPFASRRTGFQPPLLLTNLKPEPDRDKQTTSFLDLVTLRIWSSLTLTPSFECR
ncbi:hypothetical protein CROQUDRAFT_102716 [Cronartium quercuum f. sp. fusiforme G11]|uniref:Uncharacterized protein n=1 Tax=Cronartium quercuum f. sp. fusiforme G11 TaxID=708437 RepID=A0A9P6T5Z6_9BASI|nr:hypothetical protein CROQUDRAFT_102716 [Cronartium quercuum f. sp. fusiforme G11]